LWEFRNPTSLVLIMFQARAPYKNIAQNLLEKTFINE